MMLNDQMLIDDVDDFTTTQKRETTAVFIYLEPEHNHTPQYQPNHTINAWSHLHDDYSQLP